MMEEQQKEKRKKNHTPVLHVPLVEKAALLDGMPAAQIAVVHQLHGLAKDVGGRVPEDVAAQLCTKQAEQAR